MRNVRWVSRDEAKEIWPDHQDICSADIQKAPKLPEPQKLVRHVMHYNDYIGSSFEFLEVLVGCRK